MLPFLKIVITLAGEPAGGERAYPEDDKEVECMIQPTHIAAYHPGYYWGSFIYLNNGQVLCAKIECDVLELKIKEYWSQVTAFTKAKSSIIS